MQGNTTLRLLIIIINNHKVVFPSILKVMDHHVERLLCGLFLTPEKKDKQLKLTYNAINMINLWTKVIDILRKKLYLDRKNNNNLYLYNIKFMTEIKKLTSKR